MATNVATLQVVIQGDTRGLTRSLSEADRSIGNFAARTGSSLQRTGSLLTGALTVPLVGIGAAATRSAIQWESAFAGVEKTLSATEAQFAVIEQGLLDLSVASDAPVSGLQNAQTELAKIAELGGQLGVLPDNILDFTNVIGELTIATDLTGESAATMIAQFANITGMDLSAESLRGLGDAIVNVGNNMATTESNLVHFMQRIAGAASIVGFTDREIVALSGATASVGLRAESAGTSMTKLMLGIDNAVASLEGGIVSSDSLIASRTGLANDLSYEREVIMRDLAAAQERYNNAVARGSATAGPALTAIEGLQAELADVETQILSNGTALAGLAPGQMIEFEQSSDTLNRFVEVVQLAGDEFENITATDLAAMWQGPDQEKVLIGLIKGLGELDSAAQTQALDDLGLSGIRLTDMMRRLANNSGLVVDAFGYIGDSAENALSIEAEKRFATTEAQFNRMINTLRNLGITLGNVLLPPLNILLSYISGLFVAVANLDPRILKLGVGFGALLASIGPVMMVAGKLLTIFSKFTPMGLVVSGVVAAFIALSGVVAKSFLGNKQITDSIPGFIKDLQYLWQSVTKLATPFINLGKDIISYLFPALDGIGGLGNSFLQGLGRGFLRFTDFIHGLAYEIDMTAGLIGGLVSIFTSGLLSPMGLINGNDLRIVKMLSDTKFFKWLFGDILPIDAATQIFNIGKAIRESVVNFIPNLETFWATFIEEFSDDSGFNFELLATKIGDKISTGITTLINNFTTYVSNVGSIVSAFFEQIELAFNNSDISAPNTIANAIGKMLVGVVPEIETFVEKIDLSGIVTSFENLKKNLIDNGIIATVISSIEDLFNITIDSTISTSIESVAQAVVGLLAATGISKLLGFKSLPDVFKTLTKVFSGEGITTLIARMRTIGTTFGKGAVIFTIIATTIGALVDRLPELTESFGLFLENASNGDWAGALETLGKVAAVIGIVATAVGEAFAGGIIDSLPAIGDVLASFADLLAAFSSDTPQEVIANTLSALSGGLLDIVNVVGQFAIGGASALISFIGDLLGFDTSAFEQTADDLASGLDTIIQRMKEGLTGFTAGLVNELETLFTTVVLRVAQLINEIPGVDLNDFIDRSIATVDSNVAADKLSESIFGYLNSGTISEDLQTFLDTGMVNIDSVAFGADSTPIPIDFNNVTLDTESLRNKIMEAMEADTTTADPEVLSTLFESLFADAPSVAMDIPVSFADIMIAEENRQPTTDLLQLRLQEAIDMAEDMGLDVGALVDPELLSPTIFTTDLDARLQEAINAVTHELTMSGVLNFTVTGVNISGFGGEGITLPGSPIPTNQTGGTAMSTGLHLLHKGEEVLTNSESQNYRSGSNGNVEININGVQDVDSLLAELNRRGYALPR